MKAGKLFVQFEKIYKRMCGKRVYKNGTLGISINICVVLMFFINLIHTMKKIYIILYCILNELLLISKRLSNSLFLHFVL